MATQPALEAWFVTQLRSILSMVVLLQQLAGHSINTSTTAAMAGVKESTIQTLVIQLPKETLAWVLAGGAGATCNNDCGTGRYLFLFSTLGADMGCCHSYFIYSTLLALVGWGL